MPEAAGAHAVVAGVLVEQDGEDPVAEDGAVELVGVAGAHALAVSGPALAEAQLGVLDGVGAGDGGVGGVGVLAWPSSEVKAARPNW